MCQQKCKITRRDCWKCKQTEIPGKDRQCEAFWKTDLWNTVGSCHDKEGGKWNAVVLSLVIPDYFWDSSFNYQRTGILWNVQGYKVEHMQCHLSLSTCRTTNISIILRLHVEEKSRKSRLQTSDIKVTGHNFLEQCAFAWWTIPKVNLWFCNPSQK